MPLTIANVSTPNATINQFAFGPYKARVIDVTFDAAYLTTGEVLAASDLGWNVLIGALVLKPLANAAGTLSHGLVVLPNASQTSLSLLPQETGAAVDAPFKEATNAADLSLYTARLIVLGL